MFIAVKFHPQKTNKLRKLFSSAADFEHTLYGYDVLKLASAPQNRKKTLQKNLLRIYGTSRVKIVSETDIGDIKAFSSSLFMRVLLFNTALKLLETSKIYPSVVLVDIHGVCSSFIDKLAFNCRTLRIITCRPERYIQKQQFLLNEYGISVTLASPCAYWTEADIYLLVDNRIGDFLLPLPQEGVILRITGTPAREKDYLITSPEIPVWANDIIPEGFSAATILGAFYEINREERCENLCAATFTDYNRTILKLDKIINVIIAPNTHI